MCLYVYLCEGYVHMGTGNLRDQRRQMPLQLEISVVANLLMWVLGKEVSS